MGWREGRAEPQGCANGVELERAPLNVRIPYDVRVGEVNACGAIRCQHSPSRARAVVRTVVGVRLQAFWLLRAFWAEKYEGWRWSVLGVKVNKRNATVTAQVLCHDQRKVWR